MNIYPKDIGEFCHIAFIESNFQNSQIKAMISTKQSEQNPQYSRQYGLGIGKNKFQITATAENEASITKLPI